MFHSNSLKNNLKIFHNLDILTILNKIKGYLKNINESNHKRLIDISSYFQSNECLKKRKLSNTVVLNQNSLIISNKRQNLELKSSNLIDYSNESSIIVSSIIFVKLSFTQIICRLKIFRMK